MAASDPTPYVATPTGTLQGVAAFSWDGSAWQPSGRAGPDVATSTGVLQGVAPFSWSGSGWTPAGGAQPGVATPSGVLDGVAVYTWSGSAWTPTGGTATPSTPSGTLRGVAAFSWDGAAWQPAAQARPAVATPYGVLDGVAFFNWGGSTWQAGAAVPAGATLDLSFMSGTLNPLVAFTRASTATYFDSSGTMQTAATNGPRFDYDPVTHSLRGLLMEEARTNLIPNSGDASAASWAPTGATSAAPTITANQTVAPDGTVTAARMAMSAVSAAAAGCYVLVNNVGPTVTAAVYTFSVWLRGNAGGEQLYLFTTPNGSTYFRQSVTLTTSWQRFTLVTGTLTAAGWFFGIGTDRRDASQGTTLAQTIFVWGAQVELGAFQTSYIPTGAATVTRAVDVCYAPVGAWYNQNTQTIMAEFYLPTLPAGAMVGVSDGAFGDSFYLAANTIATRAGAATANGSAFTVGAVNKIAGSLSVTAVRCCTNAGAVGSAVNAVIPPAATWLSVGTDPWSLGSPIDGHVRRVRFWPRVLSDTELQSVTT